MNKPKGKVIFLLCLSAISLLLPFFLYIPLQLVKSSQHRALKDYTVHDPRLAKIILSKYDYSRFVNDDEFIYDNKRFDIKSVTESEGNYIIEALADDDETQWKNIESAFISKSAQTTDTRNFVFVFLYFEAFPSPFLSPQKQCNPCPYCGSMRLMANLPPIPSPPPEMA